MGSGATVSKQKTLSYLKLRIKSTNRKRFWLTILLDRNCVFCPKILLHAAISRHPTIDNQQIPTTHFVSQNKYFRPWSEYTEKLAASGGLRSLDPLPWLCPWTPLGDFRLLDPLPCPPAVVINRCRDRMSFVSNDNYFENLRIGWKSWDRNSNAWNAKVSGRKHELMDRRVLWIRMVSCRAMVSLFDRWGESLRIWPNSAFVNI